MAKLHSSKKFVWLASVILGLTAILPSSFGATLAANQTGSETVKAVFALKYGEFNSFPNYGVYWMGEPRFATNQSAIPVFMYFWLIQTDQHNILVDTGTGEDYALRYAPYVSPVVMLSRLDLTPADIDTIIISHPHFDHVDGLKSFSTANIYLQREAYRFLTEVAPASAFIRDSGFPRKQDAMTMMELMWNGRLQLLDGDIELFSGISLVKVDGHHPGHQITVVQTGAKHVVLASDAVHQYVNLEKNLPMGLFQGDFADLAKSLETIRRMNGVVVAGHDKQVMTRFRKVHDDIVQIFPY
jgi:glyoxylase-like metal-dependent hydrolase (beta-lactamase superfamily II)